MTESRAHERVPCDLPAELFSLSSGARICALRLRDLGAGGALAEAPVPLQRGLGYELRLRGGKFPARVTRELKPDLKTKVHPYGLVFTLTAEQERRLTAIVAELRRRLWT